MSAVPVDPSLFTWPDDPHLVGSSCPHCHTTTFPAQASCPRCTRPGMTEVALAGTGTLWSFTVQGFQPKPPFAGEGPWQPYGVGYVELAAATGAAVLVEGRLTESDPELLRIGDPMEVTFVPFRHDADGREVVTFAFTPAGPTTTQPAAATATRAAADSAAANRGAEA